MSRIKNFKVWKNYNIHAEFFDSAAEVADACESRSITNSSFYDVRQKSDWEWCGVKDYAETIDLLRTGYQPIVENLRKAFKSNISGTEMKRYKAVNDMQGFAPIVPLALKGIPNNMLNTVMTPMKAKVVDVYYDTTFSCGVNSKQIIECGNKMLSAIIELEKQGYRFNLYAVQSYSNSSDCDMLVVKVKSADKPIDLKRISYPIAHTAFFRVTGFDWYSKVPDGKHRFGYGHGLAYEKKDDELDAMAKQIFGRNALYISGKRILNKDEEYLKNTMSGKEG